LELKPLAVPAPKTEGAKTGGGGGVEAGHTTVEMQVPLFGLTMTAIAAVTTYDVVKRAYAKPESEGRKEVMK